jgi:dihydrolipoamide dehydrogenase
LTEVKGGVIIRHNKTIIKSISKTKNPRRLAAVYYDVVVMGAGPGGYVSAIRAAQLGAKTAIIEKDQVGGTCLNVGCIPTKALIKNVEILHSIEIGKQRGIKVQEISLDYRKAVKAKDKAVKQLVHGVEVLLSANQIDLYRGTGTVQENHTILVTSEENGTQEIQYGKLIIATGSRPAAPPFAGSDLDGVMTSTEMLKIDCVPEKLVIIGGGVIGCEFASIFKAYGSQVTIIEMMPAVVAMMDEDISWAVGEMLLEKEIQLKLGQQVKEIRKNTDDSLEVVTVNGEGQTECYQANQVLISIGRKPNIEGLEALQLEAERGYIKVTDKLETNVADVYAIGDVTGKKMLAHVATEMGIRAAENATGQNKLVDLDIVPSCLYTIPEVGSVGLTEAEAKAKGKELLVGRFPLTHCGKAVASGEPEGLFKIIADKETRVLLGAHLIGKSATEVVAEMTAYMKMGASIDDVIDTIHAHPTISEAVAEAARDLDGCCIHKL